MAAWCVCWRFVLLSQVALTPQLTFSVSSSRTTRLSLGERPVFWPEVVARAPELTTCVPGSYLSACDGGSQHAAAQHTAANDGLALPEAVDGVEQQQQALASGQGVCCPPQATKKHLNYPFHCTHHLIELRRRQVPEHAARAYAGIHREGTGDQKGGVMALHDDGWCLAASAGKQICSVGRGKESKRQTMAMLLCDCERCELVE